jgi:hypothetical protein
MKIREFRIVKDSKETNKITDQDYQVNQFNFHVQSFIFLWRERLKIPGDCSETICHRHATTARKLGVETDRLAYSYWFLNRGDSRLSINLHAWGHCGKVSAIDTATSGISDSNHC